MITRLSTLFLRTLREDPADAEVPSHKLLVRAGYIRRVAPGIYSWLPLGLRAVRNIEAVVREEMDAIGGQELLFPALLPREPYETTQRWTEYGDSLFRLKDRKGADYLLGPTHEEMFAATVKDLYNSYKDFPVTLYQIQTKYRDEERPRAGVLRGREFVMKDSYSFDISDAGLDESYAKHRAAYQRIFDRLGLEYAICQATSGAMGGSASEEFLAVSENGEDTFVRSTSGNYAANVEAVVTQPGVERDIEGLPEAVTYETPVSETIDALVDWANSIDVQIEGREVTAADTLKCIVVKVREPGAEEAELTGILLPGDREVDMKRLEASLEPAEVELAVESDFADNPFLVKGYVGPVGLAKNGVKVLADPRVVTGTSWITGADEKERHVVGLVAGRDFTPDGFIEAAEIKEGDPAPAGEGTLTLARGIEIGHIFQLGRKYTEAFDVQILDENGKRAIPTMGSYGLGVTRLLAVLAEQRHDDAGLNWSVEVAPYQVHVVAANKDAAAIEAAERFAAELSAAGLDVLFDDRPKVSPGVKFKDAELLGMPFALILGRGYAEGKVELRVRGGEKSELDADQAVAQIVEMVAQARN
ncbi:prolyl-tRNA synthetase [Corynebacterium glutamicum MB001]|uniref:Proline--tRNA ligase n=2 Tax=Corynebacterium glutamicum TaxID=1718 RepID=SYP_CORGL|nr:proline--tRNA ligase [Corynebacterium glutamicum]Q8NP31.1 RecName: Full=Proline--tRNA ligase; AltName: Full=Prolyl-tRNA synthetase; Short=ProRS [Corynebacterium glutamicum ATCC 13032]AGN19504.1 prolyl-tRNA ligase [Corynebacterium glutamicum SCgG1]AGN22529.1 prolyl-tRNA ligase [Corynebacterium glutamicum SCgG2]AGT05734.1 prolyl-tRNA synthetase [Corynebacterium glutamicum MB001]AIK85430.1 prolyl-tRNA synthetase [Corynebacterium glutamicum]AIK88215.1 prolyl-tRNA synthetase [Corynebacterium gl